MMLRQRSGEKSNPPGEESFDETLLEGPKLLAVIAS